MRIGIVGCGYVAEFYGNTLPLHPELELVAVADRDVVRRTSFARAYGATPVASVEELLADDRIEMIVNLTNPRGHHDVTRAALAAGRHVYSEKPLAMEFGEARELVELARSQGVELACAPCSVLGEAAQGVWRAIRGGTVGTPLLAYAEMDDGLLSAMNYRDWVNDSGVPWPHRDEFEVGCTIEHAAYSLSWLLAMFGPATRVVSFGSVQDPGKLPPGARDKQAPDVTMAAIRFAGGMVARLTCSIIAPHDHGLTVIGDRGVISVHDTWDYFSSVRSRRRLSVRRKTFLSPVPRPHRLPKSGVAKPPSSGAATMDFARGPAELAASVRERRPCRIGAEFSLHVNEAVLAIHHSVHAGAEYEMTTSFTPPEPMPWAR